MRNLTPASWVAIAIVFFGAMLVVADRSSGGVLTDWWNGETFVAQRDGYNSTSTAGLSITAVDDPGNDRVNYTYNVSLASATSTATSSTSGLAFVNSTLGFLMGCADNEIIKWDSATTNWACDTDTGGAGGDAFFWETAIATDDFAVYRFERAVTLTEVCYLAEGGTNWVGQLQEYNSNGDSPVDTQSSDTTAVAGTSICTTSFSNAEIDADDWFGPKTASVSGTNTNMRITWYFKWEP